MLGIPQQGLLIATLLLATVTTRGHAAKGYTAECVPRELCMDTDALQRLAENVAGNITSAHDWRILLQMKQFREITRWRNLHGCVMLRVAYFYERVFREKLGLTEDEDIGDHRGPLVDLLGLMQHLDDCARMTEGRCEKLNAKAEKMPQIKTSPIKEMTPRKWAILQLQQLNEAINKISEEETLNKALDELKRLHHYIKGRGVQKWSSD